MSSGNEVMDAMLMQSVANTPRYGNTTTQDLANVTLNTDELLAEFERLLRGQIWDGQKGAYILVHKPIANDDGVNALMKMLRFKVHKLIPLSNLPSEKDIENSAKKFHKEVINILWANSRKYDIDDFDLSLTVNYITSLYFYQLMRAFKDGERQLLATTTQRHEHVIDRPENKSGFLKGLFKGGV